MPSGWCVWFAAQTWTGMLSASRACAQIPETRGWSVIMMRHKRHDNEPRCSISSAERTCVCCFHRSWQSDWHRGTLFTTLTWPNCSPTHNDIHAVCHLPGISQYGIHFLKVPDAIKRVAERRHCSQIKSSFLASHRHFSWQKSVRICQKAIKKLVEAMFL